MRTSSGDPPTACSGSRPGSPPFTMSPDAPRPQLESVLKFWPCDVSGYVPSAQVGATEPRAVALAVTEPPRLGETDGLPMSEKRRSETPPAAVAALPANVLERRWRAGLVPGPPTGWLTV